MEIGDEILIRAKVIDFDSNPHGPAVKVRIESKERNINPMKEEFWIHRLDIPHVIYEGK